jgi:PAS domain S-box-containing protein
VSQSAIYDDNLPESEHDRVARIWMISCVAFGMLALFVAGIFLYQQSTGTLSIVNSISTTELVLVELENARSGITDAETGQRGFLLTGKESYLDPYTSALAGVDARLDKLRTLSADDPIQQALLVRIALPIKEKFAELKQTIKLYRTEGFNAALHVVNNDSGKTVMDTIRSDISAMIELQTKQLDQRKALLQAKIRSISTTFASLAVLAMGLFWAFAYFMRRYVVAIGRLRKNLIERSQFRKEQAELLELTYDAIMVRDLADGTIRYWNKGAHDLYGFTAEEAIGRKSHELLKTQFPTALEEIEKEAPAVGHWEGELIQTTKDNRKLTVASRWRFKADTAGQLSSILETDITERKRGEEEILRAQAEKILQQERSNEELLELTYDAIMVRNLADGTIRYWNKGAQDLYGFTPEEAIGRTSHELLKTQFPTALEEIEKQAPAIGHWEGELIQTTKDNRKLTVASRWRFKADDEGHLSSILETDITDRKRNEETILRAKEEKLVELERSNEELQQFAYVCSHDLQEPLRVVSNFSQLLGNRYKGKLDDKADQFIEFIVDGSKRMQNLINDLLIFSRVQSKGQELSDIDCRTAVDMARANLQMAIEETGATVNCDPLPTIKGDTSQLMQLFQNLVGNALKFRSAESPKINISADKRGDAWQFAVSDNGLGLDMQFAERIFVIFQRLHTKEKFPGSGLGLAVCRKIVQRHGGRIWVESELGKGTTFYFTMPMMKAEGRA